MTLSLKANIDNKVALLPHFKKNEIIKARTTCIKYCKADDSERLRLESFIALVFKKFYNANLEHFYPNLISIESANHNNLNDNYLASNTDIRAVAGFRCAEQQPLFSEYYLSQPLEAEIKHLYGNNISRKHIVEVGNLAPANVGQMRWLIASITAFLYSAGFHIIIFTLTPSVSNAFERMDLPLKFIADAKQSHLPESIQNEWGPQYYQANPRVMTGDIEQGFKIMKQTIYSLNPRLIALFEQACLLGQQFSLSYKKDIAA